MSERLRLVVDPIACDGRGLCAELLAELVTLDDWGYPIVARGDVPAELLGAAREAVRLCPKLALRLEPATSDVSAPHLHLTGVTWVRAQDAAIPIHGSNQSREPRKGSTP